MGMGRQGITTLEAHNCKEMAGIVSRQEDVADEADGDVQNTFQETFRYDKYNKKRERVRELLLMGLDGDVIRNRKMQVYLNVLVHSDYI